MEARLPRRLAFGAAALAAAMAACSDSTAPVPIGDRYVLASINGVSLPTKPAAFTYLVIADTLVFGVTSSRWKPSPLARATRIAQESDGHLLTEEWWYTYDSSEPLPSPFDIRLLCADGDTTLAACIDGRARATLDSTGLTLSFNEPIFGVLKYTRLP